MESINIIFDIERSSKVYKKYFAFEFKRTIKRFPIFWITAVSAGFIIFGIVSIIDMWITLGLIILLGFVVYILYCFIRFKISENNCLKQLEQLDISSERDFVFSFDENEIKYESKNTNSKITWELIKYYTENQNDLYLFLENHQLYDIISKSTMRKEKYEKFKKILERKSTRYE